MAWLAIGTAAVVATAVVGALATRGSSPGTTRVRGEQLSRPGTGSTPPSSSALPTTTTTSQSTPGTSTGAPTTTSAPPGASGTTPRSTPLTGKPTTAPTTGKPAPTTPSTAPAQLGPALTITRVLTWSPGVVAQRGTDVWAADTLDSGRLARVDTTGARAQGRVQAFVSGLAPVAGGAWVLRSRCPSSSAELVHVDMSATPTSTLPLPQTIVCDVSPGRSALAATPGALWVATADPAHSGRGLLLDVDPVSGAVVDRVALAGVPHDVQTDGATVWVTVSGAPGMSRVDLAMQAFDSATRQPAQQVVVPSPFGYPIVRDGDVWAGGSSGLRRLSVDGGAEQLFSTDGPGCGSGQRFGFVAGAVTATTVWGTRLDLAGNGPTGPVTQATMCRIDIATSQTTGWSPGAFAVAGGDDNGVWLVDQARGGLVRWSLG